VHLAVPADDSPSAVDHQGRVVIEPGGTALEHTYDHAQVQLPRERTEGLGARPGHGLREVEQGGVLRLTEIARPVELRQTDQAGTVRRGLAGERKSLVQVARRFRLAAHLHETQFDSGSHFSGPDAR
jgi:hypothetical protein